MASERESPALRKARERRLRAVASLEKAVRNLEGVSATSQASAGSGGPPVPQDEPPQSAVETAEAPRQISSVCSFIHQLQSCFFYKRKIKSKRNNFEE